MALDGFGSRTNGIDSEGGDEVELLDLAPQLVEHSGFVAALGERVARMAAVKHASYVHLRRLDRPSSERLELVSDLTPGWRLSDLLQESNAANIPVDITVVIGLLRQLLPAVALYGRNNRDAAIGSLAVERIIVTPQARLVIAEHAFGPALEKLNLGRDRLWRELRVAMPPSAGLPRSNQRADANAIGVVALSLLLGRVLDVEEYPSQLQALVDGIQEHRGDQPSALSTPFANWLKRALQFDVRTAFQAPSEAQLAFESVLASDRSYVTSSAKLEEWASIVGRIIDAKRRPPEPDPPPVPPPPPPEPEAEPYVAPEPEPIVAAAPLASEAPRFEEAAADQPQLEALSAPAVEEWAPQAAAVAPVDLAERRTDPADVRAGGSRMPLMIMAGVIALLIGAESWRAEGGRR
jgi:hypothetical protein